jgi:hypothetical protein
MNIEQEIRCTDFVLLRRCLFTRKKEYFCNQIPHCNETKKTENQVCGHILPLLVCPFGHSGGWHSEIPDIG